MRHYQNVLLCCLFLWLVGAGMAAWAVAGACEAREEMSVAAHDRDMASRRACSARRELETQELAMPPVRKFLNEWEPHLRRGSDEREVGIAIRSGLEALAQQRLSLVTDQATTPEPGKILVGAKSWRVQRVSLRASGESLTALVTWLGEAERTFPYARVEAWELVSAGGVNCSLRAVLSQPLTGESAEKHGGLSK